MRLLCALVVALAAAACGDGPATPPAPPEPEPSPHVGLEIQLREYRYHLDSRVGMQLMVWNAGPTPLVVPAGEPWIAGQMRFGVEVIPLGADDQPYVMIPPPGPYVAPLKEHFVVLKPGENLTVPLEVGDYVRADYQESGELVKLSHREGTYRVRVRLTSDGERNLPPEGAFEEEVFSGVSRWTLVEFEVGR